MLPRYLSYRKCDASNCARASVTPAHLATSRIAADFSQHENRALVRMCECSSISPQKKFESAFFRAPQVPNSTASAAGNKSPIKFVCASRDSDDRPPLMTL